MRDTSEKRSEASVPDAGEGMIPAGLVHALADRYRLERELGRGGMATVYLADDLKHGRKVAIKFMHPELATAIGPDRFLREIAAAARLSHPHILPLFDSGRADGLFTSADTPSLTAKSSWCGDRRGSSA